MSDTGAFAPVSPPAMQSEEAPAPGGSSTDDIRDTRKSPAVEKQAKGEGRVQDKAAKEAPEPKPDAPAPAFGSTPPPPAQAPAPASVQPDFDKMTPAELMNWMESLAKRQGAAPESSVTQTGQSSVDLPSLMEASQSVLFSAYYPKEVVPEQWQPLHAYIFRAFASSAVEEDAGKQLGERKPDFRGVRAPALADVPEGAMVTATPHMDGFQFNPPSISLGFYKDWHRFDFELRAKGAPLNQSTNGLLTFTVEGIIVADIPLSLFVGESVSAGDNHTSAAAKLYQAIFCSYSHRDTQIVARAERAYKALGLEYLRDVVSLKSGQEWDAELLNLISRADIFQLFWSSAAANSDYVRQEWQHALKLSGNRANFIRPVYWEEPQPPIPTELEHIHFAYQPDLDD